MHEKKYRQEKFIIQKKYAVVPFCRKIIVQLFQCFRPARKAVGAVINNHIQPFVYKQDRAVSSTFQQFRGGVKEIIKRIAKPEPLDKMLEKDRFLRIERDIFAAFAHRLIQLIPAGKADKKYACCNRKRKYHTVAPDKKKRQRNKYDADDAVYQQQIAAFFFVKHETPESS